MLWQQQSPIRKRKVPFLSILGSDSANEKPCTLFTVAPPTPQLPFLLYKNILLPLPCGNLQGWGTQIIILCKSWMNPSLLEKCLPSICFWLTGFVNRKIPYVQASFRKGRGIRDQIANIRWIVKKQESSRKISISALLTTPKLLIVWITINCGKFWKR